MLRHALSLAILAVARTPQAPSDPRAIVREVTTEVEAGRAPDAEARWGAIRARDAASPAAQLALATLARLTYDYPLADSLYRGLLAAPVDRRFAAYAGIGLAEGMYAQGLLGEIDGLLVQARAQARAAGDSAAEAEALAGLARVRTLSQGVEAGLGLIDTGLAVTPRQAADVRALLDCTGAQFMTVMGKPRTPERLRAALAFARHQREPRAQAVCLRALSLEHRFAGRSDSSFAVLRELEALRRRTRDRSRLAEALFLQGDVLQEFAAYGQANEVLHQALAEARASHNLYIQASVNLGLAALYFRLNDNATATAYVNQAVADYEVLADTGSVMMARSWRMQVSIAAGDLDSARAETRDVIRFFHREGDVTHESSLYQALADISMKERDWSGAEWAIARAEALLRGHSSAAANAALPRQRGRLALARGDLGTAETEFRRYLAAIGASEQLARSETRAYLAEIEARRGQLDRAERDLAAAGAELDEWRAGLGDRDLRALAFQASSSEANDRNSSIARVLALLAGSGRAASAFELAEHRRARDLADRMRRAEALKPGLEEGADTGTTVGREQHRITAGAMASLIPDDHTVLVEYVTGALGAPTTAFVVGPRHLGSRGDPVRAALLAPADSLAATIGRFVEVLQGGGDAPALARALGAAVLDPILGGLGPEITGLVIVPDGPLHRLPFDALRLADGHYAVERFTISTAPSAGIVADLWRARGAAPASNDTVRLLALGDPAFPRITATGATARDAAEAHQAAFEETGGLPRLEGSAREVRRVARYADLADVRTGDAASAAYLKRADLSRYRILHFATHALVDEYAVARSALVLAPGDGESGFVGSGELALLHLGADLVVLSACRTAGGVVVDGEGILGLSAPLLQAGARSIVATLWPIGDRATLGVIDAFYDEMAAGLPEAEALRAAKLRMIRARRPAAEWGALTLVGDPSITLPLHRPTAALPAWLPVAVLAAAGAAYWWRAGKKRAPRNRSRGAQTC